MTMVEMVNKTRPPRLLIRRCRRIRARKYTAPVEPDNVITSTLSRSPPALSHFGVSDVARARLFEFRGCLCNQGVSVLATRMLRLCFGLRRGSCPECNAKVRGVADPRTAAVDPEIAISTEPRRIIGRRPVVAIIEAIVQPLPCIAGHDIFQVEKNVDSAAIRASTTNWP